MPFCRNCGTKLPEGAVYCSNCGTSVQAPIQPVLADWGERFVAWLIDIIILGAFLGWITWPGYVWMPLAPRWVPFIDFGAKNVIHFLYWMAMEGIYGQSIGKMVMKIRLAQSNGGSTDIMHAAIQSVGKAFLLPIDCVVGWILYPTRKQRLFNYISDTIVVKTSR